jgi:hypothetical protein
MAANSPDKELPTLVRIEIHQNQIQPDDFLVILETSEGRAPFHIPRRMLGQIAQQFLDADERFPRTIRPN